MSTTTSGALGRVTGWITAPLFAAASFARHARTFHPRGHAFVARSLRHPDLALELAPLAARLTGDALVRFSGALWKDEPHLPDVLGCAVRFRHDASETAEPELSDQDLLFATIVRPWTMPLAPVTTNVEDYLANDYYAVSPFDVGLDHALYFRLRPERPARHVIGDRDARIDDAVARGVAAFEIDASASPWGPWSPVVRVTLLRAAHVDQEALRFEPFRAGRGVVPRGFVHALRRGAYAMSQWARPRTVP
jgi:hypothetical protein